MVKAVKNSSLATFAQCTNLSLKQGEIELLRALICPMDRVS